MSGREVSHWDGKVLPALRARAHAKPPTGWTQQALAEALGVRRNTVTRWEIGDRSPDIRILGQLADLLDVSISVLLTLPDRPTLRYFRERAGLTQVQVAEEVGLSDGGVRSVENGHAFTRPEVARRWAELFNLSFEEFYAAWEASRDERKP